MIRSSRYFKLREQKNMKDGHFVEANQKLLYICTEENKMLVRTADDTNIVRLFWVSESDIDFVEEIVEEWSQEMVDYLGKEIKGNWI
jgi:hypothetical protein